MYINTFQCQVRCGRAGRAALTLMETIPRNPHQSNRPRTATRRFYGSLYLDDSHRQRMERLKAQLGYRKGRDTAAYYAAMYLLTANKSLYRHAANCFCRNGIEFGYVTLRGMSSQDYTLYSAAREIYTDAPGVSLADLASGGIVDPLAFSLIINALLVARYGSALLDGRERGSSA